MKLEAPGHITRGHNYVQWEYELDGTAYALRDYRHPDDRRTMEEIEENLITLVNTYYTLGLLGFQTKPNPDAILMDLDGTFYRYGDRYSS